MKLPYTTLLIDDEPPARIRLHRFVSKYPETFEIIGEADNGEEAVKKINSLHPDLIFLDVQMPELNGFEVLKQIHYNPKVIFCTAFDEFALKAFDTHCVDYLVKPLNNKRFEKTIDKLKQFQSNDSDQNLTNLIQQFALANERKEASTIPVKVGDRIIFIRLDEVSFFKADEKYAVLVTKHAKEYILDSSLKKLEEKIPGYFIRVHKSYIVNKNLLKEVRKHFNNRFVLIMDDYQRNKITSGRSYYSTIKGISEL